MLVATSGVEEQTSNGAITFAQFSYSENGSKIPPVVDSSGDVIFIGTPLIGTEFGRPSIWRWDSDPESEVPLSKVIDLDDLPLVDADNQPIPDQEVQISSLSISPLGRIALLGAVYSGGDGVAQVLWAQDENGTFSNVITRNPFSDKFYPNETLTVGDGTGGGGLLVEKIASLSTPDGGATDASGGQDGLFTPWWTPEERLIFSVAINLNGVFTSYICQATIGKANVIPKGDTFIWDGGAGTNDWETITDGRSNWKDGFGTPWDKVPGSMGNEKVIIIAGSNVELNANVSIRELTLENSMLSVSANLAFTHSFKGVEGSVLNLESGSQINSEGDFTTAGAIVKNGSVASTVKIDDFEVNGGSVTLKSGTLNFENTISNFVDTAVLVENGLFAFDENVTAFRGANTTIVVKNGTLDLDVFALSFEDGVGVMTESSKSTVKVGRTDSAESASITLRSGGSVEPRTFTLNGSGKFELRKDIDLAAGDRFVNNQKGPEGTGLFINIAGDDALTVPDGAVFENRGKLTVQDGGLIYASESNVGSEILNRGELIVPEESQFDRLDFRNESVFRVDGTIKLGRVEFIAGSQTILNSGVIAPFGNLNSDVHFLVGSLVIPKGEGCRIELPSQFALNPPQRPVNFEATLLSFGDAGSLLIENAVLGSETSIGVDEDTEVTFDNLLFSKASISGLGKALFKGAIQPRAEGGELSIGTLNWEIDCAEFGRRLDEAVSAEYHFEGEMVDDDDDGDPESKGSGIIKDINVFPGSKLFASYGVDVLVEGPFRLAEVPIVVAGDWTIVTDVVPLNNERSTISLVGLSSSLTIGDETDQTFMFDIDIDVGKYSDVVIKENTVVSVFGILDALNRGTLSKGTWDIRDGASFILDFPTYPNEIEIIEEGVVVELGKAHPTLASFQNLPNPENDLTILGTLELGGWSNSEYDWENNIQ